VILMLNEGRPLDDRGRDLVGMGMGPHGELEGRLGYGKRGKGGQDCVGSVVSARTKCHLVKP